MSENQSFTVNLGDLINGIEGTAGQCEDDDHGPVLELKLYRMADGMEMPVLLYLEIHAVAALQHIATDFMLVASHGEVVD